MDNRLIALLSTATRFASNEDEFGVYLQGFISGAIAASTEIEEVRLAMGRSVSVENSFCASGALYESYLTGKRITETRHTHEPEEMRALRRDAIRVVIEILTAKEEHDRA